MKEPSSARTTVRRMPERGTYDRDTIHSIIDEALICHVGFIIDDAPFVIPTIHARIGDVLYLHGSPGSRMLRHLKKGAEVCVTVTLLDGLVLARSALHHSMNYRSVVVVGASRPVADPDEKMAALEAVVEHVAPGRWAEIRGPSADEFRKTEVVALGIDEASAKIRTGPVKDEPEDYELAIWAGLLPLVTTAAAPEPDAELPAEIAVPEHVTTWGSPAGRLTRRGR